MDDDRHELDPDERRAFYSARELGSDDVRAAVTEELAEWLDDVSMDYAESSTRYAVEFRLVPEDGEDDALIRYLGRHRSRPGREPDPP